MTVLLGTCLTSCERFRESRCATEHEGYVIQGPELNIRDLFGCMLVMLLLMAEILHHLRLVVYPIIYRVLYIPGGTGFLPSTVSVKSKEWQLYHRIEHNII